MMKKPCGPSSSSIAFSTIVESSGCFAVRPSMAYASASFAKTPHTFPQPGLSAAKDALSRTTA